MALEINFAIGSHYTMTKRLRSHGSFIPLSDVQWEKKCQFVCLISINNITQVCIYIKTLGENSFVVKVEM